MNKSELIAKIATKTGLTLKEAAAALNAFQAVILGALKAGENVQVTGFGTFEVKTRAARQGHNPRTGEAVEIPEKKEPVFKAGKGLKNVIDA